MSSETLPNMGLPQVSIPSPNKYTPDFWVNKPHPAFGFLEVQARDGTHRGWMRFLPPQGFLIFGRDLGAAHIFVGHPSISNQHAVAAWDVRDGKCYILDLESEHGTFVNDQVIDHSVPFELRPGARVRFGHSAHIYVFDKLPEQLIDPNQEAPVVDRTRGGIEIMTESTQQRYDAFPEPRQEFDRPQQFHPERPPSDRDIDRRPLPRDIDRGGPPRDMDRGGPPRDMDRGGPPRDMDRGGPPRDMDRRGAPRDMDMDRRMPPRDMDRRAPPHMDRGGPPRDMDRGGGPPRDMDRGGSRRDMDRGGVPRDMDRGGPPQDIDRRGPLPPERWSPRDRDRRFDDRRPEGQGHGPGPGPGPSPRYNDRGRYDGPPRSPPPHHMGQGPRPPQHGGRSPRRGGRGSPRGGRRGRSQDRDFR